MSASRTLANPDLTALFDPRSVAVVGASDDTAKWGHALARRVIEAGADRPVHLVNRRGGTVLGRPTHRRLTDVGEQVDLVAICVPVAGFLDAIDDALAVGARAIVGITAGLGEAGNEGRAIEAEALARVRATGARLIGPNCLGVVDTTTNLHLASESFTPGRVSVLSQSGNLVIDIDDLLRKNGLGIARFASLGNQVDVTLTDLLLDCATHDGTSTIGVYVEDLRDGRAFVEAARAARANGKPVVLLAPGRSAAATRGAASHTGSLTSPTRVIDAACAAAGIHRVETPGEMVDLMLSLHQPRRARGRRVAVLTDGGGHGAVAADAAGEHGLDVALLSPRLGATLLDALWEQSSVTNPVDLAGIGEQDPMSYGRGLSALLESDEVDAVLMTGYFGGYATGTGSLAAREVAAATDIAARVIGQDKPVVLQTIYPDSPSIRALRDSGIPVYRGIAEASTALVGLVESPRIGELEALALPTAATPLEDFGYDAVRAILTEAGVTFPSSALVTTEDDAVAAATRLGYPVVLKAMGLLHKSDARGVVLDICDAMSLRAAYRDLDARLTPPSVSVEQMADTTDGVEVIVGVRRDLRFGPVLMVGLGGVFTEVLGDVAFALAPVRPETAAALLKSLHAWPLLAGARGRKPVDLDALAAVVARISLLAAAHPEIAEFEVNPVLATADGALALDARAIPIDDAQATAPRPTPSVPPTEPGA